MNISTGCEESNTCYEVAQCSELGRYMVAGRDICKGEIIFEEFPIVTAPQKNSTLICPGCFKPPNIECQRCYWPLCSTNCPKLARHEVECNLLRQRHKSRTEEEWIEVQDVLMAIRCLHLKQSQMEQWLVLNKLESNWGKWSESPLHTNALEFLQRIRKLFELSKDNFEDYEILRVFSILDTNAYEIKMPEVNIQGCYHLASIPEHSCVPNAFKTTSSETHLLTLRALKDIPKGSHIMTTYCDTLWPTSHRQKHVQWSKFFICRCIRCLDSTELGTFLSSILCPDCPRGSVSPLTPILSRQTNVILEDEEEEDIWSNIRKDYECKKCGQIFEATKCENFVLTTEQQLQDIDKHCSSDQKVDALEEWLEHWSVPPAANYNVAGVQQLQEQTTQPQPCSSAPRSKIRRRTLYSYTPLVSIHPNNAVCLDACHTLFLLYSAESENTDELVRKNTLGMHLLQATANLFGGISMFRGTIMYDLAMTKASMLARCLESREAESPGPKKDEAKSIAQETVLLLTEALENLRYEYPDQPEGQLFSLGLKQLDDLKNFLSQIFPELNINP